MVNIICYAGIENNTFCSISGDDVSFTSTCTSDTIIISTFKSDSCGSVGNDAGTYTIDSNKVAIKNIIGTILNNCSISTVTRNDIGFSNCASTYYDVSGT